MTAKILVLIASIASLFYTHSAAGNNSALTPIDYLPQSSSASVNVDCFNLQGLDAGPRLAVLSLQGLTNRHGAKIYTYGQSDRWILDMYIRDGYVKDTMHFNDPFKLIRRHRSHIKGAVVYNPNKEYTVNLATNIAGVENRVILSPEMVERFKSETGITDILDLRQEAFDEQRKAFRWYRQHIYPKQNNTVLVLGQGLAPQFDINRDYAVEFCLPTFWLPGKNDADYDVDYEAEILDFLAHTPVNIPILGFWLGPDHRGKRIGYDEFDGVRLAGYYGKFTLVSDIAGNYSYHSGVKPKMKQYKQNAPRTKKFRKYDPSKKYVALIMIESGDAPCYFLYEGFYARQWNDSQRGQVPMSIGITPSLRMLAPAVLADIYRSQSPNDYFFCSMSGAGYCYPFEGYGSRTKNPDECVKDYFCRLTAKNMHILDMDMLGIYTHPGPGWNADDHKTAKNYIYPMPGLKSLISGMHRTTYTAANGHEINGDVSVHHTISIWYKGGLMEDLFWKDRSIDQKAVDYMIQEIKTYGSDGNFLQTMFYSWHFGPRRLNMLKKQLEPEGYEFVTLDEFDALWRQSIAN